MPKDRFANPRETIRAYAAEAFIAIKDDVESGALSRMPQSWEDLQELSGDAEAYVRGCAPAEFVEQVTTRVKVMIVADTA